MDNRCRWIGVRRSRAEPSLTLTGGVWQTDDTRLSFSRGLAQGRVYLVGILDPMCVSPRLVNGGKTVGTAGAPASRGWVDNFPLWLLSVVEDTLHWLYGFGN